MKTYVCQIRVRLKEGILDPEAEAIQEALQRLEFHSVEALHLEKVFHVKLKSESAAEAVSLGRQMAQKLLANLVMEDFEVACLEEGAEL